MLAPCSSGDFCSCGCELLEQWSCLLCCCSYRYIHFRHMCTGLQLKGEITGPLWVTEEPRRNMDLMMWCYFGDRNEHERYLITGFTRFIEKASLPTRLTPSSQRKVIRVTRHAAAVSDHKKSHSYLIAGNLPDSGVNWAEKIYSILLPYNKYSI